MLWEKTVIPHVQWLIRCCFQAISHLFINFNCLLVLLQLCGVGCYFQKALVCWAKKGKMKTSVSMYLQKEKKKKKVKGHKVTNMLCKYFSKQIITWWTLHLCNNLLPVHNELWPGKKEGQTLIRLTFNFLRVCFCASFSLFDTNVNYNLVSRSFCQNKNLIMLKKWQQPWTHILFSPCQCPQVLSHIFQQCWCDVWLRW